MTWTRAKTEKVTLPTGNEAVLREVDPGAVVLNNADSDAIPEWLITQMIAEFRQPGKKSNQQVGVDLNRQNLPVYARFIDLIVRSAMLSPRIVDEPNYELDQIGIWDIKTVDKMAVFAWAMPGEEFAAAEKFPGQPNAGVEPVLPGEGVPAATVG